jgi:ParB family chromosome partitioning protein
MSQAPARKFGLGKGLNALISSDFDKSLISTSTDKVDTVLVEKIEPNPNQPRKYFDDASLNELASSIKQHGIIQPLVVTPAKNGKHLIIAGERRWRAAQIAKLSKVPVITRSSEELEQLEIALIENVQRVDLNPLEQALSIERLHDQFSMSFENIAKRLGKAASTVNNIARLIQLPEEAKKALYEGKITEGHARAILSLKDDPTRQNYLLKTIIEQNWNVRQAERYVVSIKEGIVENKKASARTLTETTETKFLGKRLGTDVRIKRMAYGGKLEITFSDDEDLDRILHLFKD